MTTYDDAVVRQLCSGVFEGNNDTKKDDSHDGKNDAQNGTNSRSNGNGDDDNDGTHANGIAHNGMTYSLHIPMQNRHMTFLFSSYPL